MKHTMTKMGDQTLVDNEYGDFKSIRNRINSEEAGFAMDLILNDKSDRVPGAVVERSFEIAKLTFQHIKENRMSVPFPFAKVYPDDSRDA